MRLDRNLIACALACAIAAAVAPAARAGTPTLDPAVRAVEAIFGGSGVHAAATHGPAGGRALTPALARLAARLRELSGESRREATRLLLRPTDGGADPERNGYSVPEAHGSPFCSAHFCIHWVSSGADAPNLTDSNGNGIPDWVETVDSVAEHAYSVENGTLGWRTPKGDGTLGGGVNLTDIYLKNIGGTGVYGYTASDPGQLGGTSAPSTLYGYVVIDNTFDAHRFPGYASPLEPLEVTVAHEYNHVLQLNYDPSEETWMFESTAVWMEGKVYPEVHDYYQYLPGWAALTQVPLTTFDGANPNDRSNVKVYGSAVWNKWLDARYGQDVVRGAWGASPHVHPASLAPAAYDASIRAYGGGGFFDAFSRFATATAEWQAHNSGFPDGAAYPDVRRVGTLGVNGPADRVHLDHTTFALLGVRRPRAARVKLVVSGPAHTESAAALVERTGPPSGGLEQSQLAELPRGGNAAISLTAPGDFDRVTAVLVNADATVSGFSQRLSAWLFTKNHELYVAHVTTDFAPPLVRARTPRPGSRHVSVGARIAITFMKPVLSVTPRSVRLIGPDGHAVRIRVRLTHGGRDATVLPVAPLRRGSRYEVRLLASITDRDLNHLRALQWSFVTQ